MKIELSIPGGSVDKDERVVNWLVKVASCFKGLEVTSVQDVGAEVPVDIAGFLQGVFADGTYVLSGMVKPKIDLLHGLRAGYVTFEAYPGGPKLFLNLTGEVIGAVLSWNLEQSYAPNLLDIWYHAESAYRTAWQRVFKMHDYCEKFPTQDEALHKLGWPGK